MRNIVLLLTLVLLTACANQNRAREISVRYGTITDVKRVPVPSAAPAGAIVGGFTGLLLARNASTGRQLMAGAGGAALGGLVTHALEGDRRAYQYTVTYKNGETARYVTENGFLHPDDCVVIERGRYSNIRRVSDALCEGPRLKTPEPKNVAEASQCHDAKEQVLKATDENEIEQAARKMRILCQF